MDRRRKGYLLRKSDAAADRPLTDGRSLPPERDCFGFAGSKSYDLQTQTITLGAEEGDRRCSCPRQTDIAVNGTANNIMDREVEFYPVDDRPSPSTFTAWDAFLAGNQAFFREPCGGVEAFAPEAAFAYMDVIPEEDDLALLESDTDDTGSSVSTVIDRFSRTSTANSSFSERSLAKCEAPVLDFDLEQVLRPFERLEKEMEEADGAKRLANGQTDAKLEADVTNCPIVVITTSSSCEDVANMEEEDGAEPSSPNRQNGVSEETEIPSVSALNHKLNNAVTINVPPSEVAQGKPKPASSKMPEKPKTKKPKTRPTSPPPLAPRKKEPYPTPSVPPRMSRHLPARRTRSDPGALEPQQPSRIPRPISRTAERAASAPKSAPRASRSPKMGIPKKLKFGDSPRDKKDKVHKSDAQPRVALESPPVQCVTNRQELDASEGEILFTTAAQDRPVFERDISADLLQRGHLDLTRETETERDEIAATHGTNGYSDSVPEDILDCASEQDKSADGANPFRSSDGNPFKRFHGNPFQELADRSNLFETTFHEEKPVLHPKGQIAPGPLLMAEAPPIPQRLSLSLSPTCPKPGDQQHSKQHNSAADRQVAKSDLPACRIDEPISGAQATCAAETFKNTDEETVTTQQKMKIPDSEQKSTRSDQNLVCSDQQQAVSDGPGGDQNLAVSGGDQRSATDGDQGEMERRRDELTQRIFEQTESLVQSLLTGREDRHTSGWGLDDALLRGDDVTPTEDPQDGSGVRPIEDILSALDHLVAQRPREVEILMEWGPEAPAHIRETDLSGSGGASGTGSPDGCRDTRKIEELLKEVDDCLRMRNASSAEEDGQTAEVDPGTADAPTVGSTSPPPGHDVTVPHHHAPDAESEDPEMLRHLRTLDPRSDFYRDGQTTVVHPRHSSGCDDSGVFLEDVLNSSPETQLRSTSRRQLSLQDDSDADDLGLASSSIDSADDLDGDPSPSTLRIEHQQPPPVPARKPSVKTYCSSEVVKRPLDKTSSLESDGSDDLKTSSEERSYNVEKTITLRSTVSRSASLGPQKLDNGFSRSLEDENICRGTLPVPQKPDNELDLQYGEDEIHHRAITSNNSADSRKLERSSHSFEDQIMHHNHSRNPLSTAQEFNNGFTSRSFDEEIHQRSKQDTKSSFLARTLQPSSFLKPEHSNLKWKSEECLRTAAEVKWSLPGRRNEKAVSVKDRIAMFSEMEASQSNGKKEESPVLHRYGSENNIKVIPSAAPERKIENEQSLKPNGFCPDNKWHSMQSIALPRKTSVTEKDVSPIPLKTSVNMSSTVPTAIIMDVLNPGAVNYSTLPLKLDVEPPKPIVSTYPETQLTNNKRYNYGLYSLKNLKNTEDLLSKKVSGNGLLSIIENRKQPLPKLKGLVIPDKPPLANHGKALPTIVTSKAESEPLKMDIRRCSLPATVVTTRSTKNHETLRQNSLAEPPWKSNGSSMATHNNTLPKYSPAFKRRTLELPGSSLSPTPPSSITSPLSPPPSSPSSVCSSNASSSVQQEVFQFSLSRSKPVTPLQPEKAVLSPPPSLLGAASDVEYEGDNSEDSSTSASPMLRDLEKQAKAPHPHNNGLLHYEKPSTFTSTALNVTLQPMLVESLSKTSNAHARHEDRYSSRTKDTNNANADPVRTQVYLSKAEILLKNDDRGAARNASLLKTTQLNCVPVDYVVLRNTTTASILIPEPDPPPGRFRAQPLKDPSKTNGPSPTYNPKGGADDSDDDDSHSTLSHRTEDSRHATTDECLSDADSCDRTTQGGGGVPMSSDGYLSTAESVDVPLRRYSRTSAADSRYSGEEYLSDATTDSNDWCPRVEQAKTQGYQRCSDDCPSDAPHDPDLRPRRLSQQRTVLKASQEPSGSVRKFRALAEEWEQRADAPASLSPPPPPCQAPPPPVPAKRDVPRPAPTNSIAAIILSTSSSKPNSNSLPPSLMPRNSVSEKKSTPAPPGRPPPRPPQLQNGSTEPRPGAAPLRNGWMDQELCGRFEGGEVSRRDSSSSSSNSSKTTLKDEEDLWHRSTHQIDASSTKRSETWQREAQRPRADVVKTFSLKKGNNSRSVSDLLRSFENQTASTPAPAQTPAKTSITEVPSKPTNGSSSSAPAAATRSITVASRSSPEHQLPLSAEEAARLTEAASLELADDRLEVAAVALSREGGGGGSVGITLAGGADYEVKEITVHKVISGGLADRDGRIRKGDRVLSINGRSLRGVSHGEALRLLKAPSARVALVLARDREQAPTRPLATNGIVGEVKLGRECVGKEPNVMLIELQKDGTGLGFSIEGGKDSPLGDRPLLIKRIFKGGATEKAGQLEEGDELVSAAGQSLVSMTRTEAWNFLKKLPDGPVFVRARRPPANS